MVATKTKKTSPEWVNSRLQLAMQSAKYKLVQADSEDDQKGQSKLGHFCQQVPQQ